MIKPDVLVIGTGTAGQSCAYDLLEEGYEVAVIERSERPGGVCALAGCQAKKWFYELAETMARCHHLQDIGITRQPEMSWQDVRDAKNRFTEKIPENTVNSLKGSGVAYYQGEARFTGPDSVAVGETTIKPRFIIIAAGAKPMQLDFAGSTHLSTSSEFLDLDEIPKRLIFVGGGFISFEFAHFAARLGAQPGEIHIIENSSRPLGPFDAEMVSHLLKATSEAGIVVHTDKTIVATEQSDSGYLVRLTSGEQLAADRVFHGAGRVADIDELNLEAAGIERTRKGIVVNESLQSTNPRVFAVGDCADTVQLARVADFEAHTAAQAIVASDQEQQMPTVDYSAIPATLFTYPQLGIVGQTEDTLQRDGVRYWKSSDNQLTYPTYRRIGMTNAAYKILVDDDSKILGAHFLSDNATGLINTFRQAMLDGTSVVDLYRNSIMTPYPSRESDIIYMLKPLLD